MILQGRNGSMVLFWLDTLMCGFPISHYTYEDYKQLSNELIVDGMRSNVKIQTQIESYSSLCNIIHLKKLKNKKINSEEYDCFRLSALALIKLQLIDEDEVVFITQPKRPRRIRLEVPTPLQVP